MSDMDRELSWDDTIQKDDNDFEPVPEGDYDFTVEKYERARSQGSDKLPPCNMAVVYFRIKGPEGREVSVRENYILHTSMEWKLSQLFRSVGLKKEGEELRMNWNALPGLTGRAHIVQKPGYKDLTKMFNHVDKLYPKEARKYSAGNF